MLQIASLSVARDIQNRAHADAARDRRANAAAPASGLTVSVATAPDDGAAQGKRWTTRFRTVLPLHRNPVDRLGA